MKRAPAAFDDAKTGTHEVCLLHCGPFRQWQEAFLFLATDLKVSCSENIDFSGSFLRQYGKQMVSTLSFSFLSDTLGNC